VLPSGIRFSLDEFPVARLALGTETHFFNDIHQEEQLDPATMAIFTDAHARALGLLPLWVGVRQVGTLMLISDQPHQFSEAEIRPYRSLANQMAFVIENRQLFEKTQKSLAETEKLYNASRRLTHARDLQEITAAIIEGLEITDINRGLLMIFELDALGEIDTARIVANWHNGLGSTPVAVGARLPRPTIKNQPLLTSPTPVFCTDIATDQRIDPNSRTTLRELNARSFAILPLWVGAATPIR